MDMPPEAIALQPVWAGLDPIRAQHDALSRFLHEELPTGVEFTAAGMTLALKLCAEFNEIWPHRVPALEDVTNAFRAGRLAEKIAELNAAFRGGH